MQNLPKLIVATRNAHKTEEIRDILGHLLSISDVNGMDGLPEIEETGTTFLENARLKALGISSRTDGWVLADDSGLEVDALEGRPGVWSSSFGGEEGNHALNNERLMQEMAGKGAGPHAFSAHWFLRKMDRKKEFFGAPWRAGSRRQLQAAEALDTIPCSFLKDTTNHSPSLVPKSKASSATVPTLSVSSPRLQTPKNYLSFKNS